MFESVEKHTERRRQDISGDYGNLKEFPTTQPTKEFPANNQKDPSNPATEDGVV